MAKKKTALHKKHISTKLGISVITVVALILTFLVATQYNQQQNLFSNAAQDTAVTGKIYSIYPNHCVSAPKNSKSGDKVTIQPCKNGDKAQEWVRTKGIVDRLYTNNDNKQLCLATDKMAVTSGTTVEVVSCGTGSNKAERWAEVDENGKIKDGGIFKLHGIDECLSADKFDVKDGHTLMISKCQNPLYKSQEWHFLQLTTSTGSGGGSSNGGGGSSGGGSGSGGGGTCTTNCGQSAACNGVGGTCESYSSTKTGGHFTSGLCPGSSSWQCWIPGSTASSCQKVGEQYCASTGGCYPVSSTCPTSGGGGGTGYTCASTGGTCVPKNACGGLTPCHLTGGTCQPGFVCNKNTSSGGGGGGKTLCATYGGTCHPAGTQCSGSTTQYGVCGNTSEVCCRP